MPPTTSLPDIRLAVIGAGRWGRNLVRVAGEITRAELVAVADVDPGRLESLREGVRAEVSAEAVISAPDVDAVLIATPAALHADLAVNALTAGKHVFVEKPVALDVADAERVARVAASVGKVVLVGHIVHYDPAYAALATLIADGELGALRALHAVRHAEAVRGDSGAFWSLGPHDVSFALRCAGAVPSRVSARRDMLRDQTAATLVFDSGLAATIDICGRAPSSRRLLAAVGERSAALVDASSRRSRLWVTRARDFSRLASAWKDAAARTDFDAFVASAKATGTVLEPIPLPDVEPLRAEIDAFVQAVLSGRAHPTTALDAVEVTRVMSRIDAATPNPPDRAATRRGEESSRAPALAFP